MRYLSKVDWFEMWEECRKGIIATMYKNMAADLECGYDPCGLSITQQKDVITEYEKAYKNQLYAFAEMTAEDVNRWCFYDMKVRGDIE